MLCKIAQLHNVTGGRTRFLYKGSTNTVSVMQFDFRGDLEWSDNMNKDAGRSLWNSLVNQGWKRLYKDVNATAMEMVQMDRCEAMAASKDE